MSRTLKRTLLTTLSALLVAQLLFAEAESWVFEGLISESDPALAPQLKSGWVLAGSFLLDPLEMTESLIAEDLRTGRLTDGITDGELTVDLYYSVKFEALQMPGPAGFDFTDNDSEKDNRDLLGWFFPIRGQLGDSGWSLQWLQIWQADPSGNMIRTVPPPIPQNGFAWEKGWFRLTFQNEEGEEAFADGHLSLFSPADALDEQSEQNRISGIVAELSDALQDRDARISSLQGQLAETTERLDSLRRMVDLLVEERTMLLEDNARLKEKTVLADPEVEEKFAELTSEKALLEDDLKNLKDLNQALAESLSESEFERRQLRLTLQELEEKDEAIETEETPSVPKATGNLRSPDGKAVGTITVYEKPVVIEKPMATPVPVNAKEVRTASREVGEEPSRRKFGPRKFR